MVELELCNLPLEDRHVGQLMTHLPRLRALDLSGCKKLSPHVVPHLLPRSGANASALVTLNLQRCYQLTAGVLSASLAAAAGPDSRLGCAAFSHLDMNKCSNMLPLSAAADDDGSAPEAATTDPVAEAAPLPLCSPRSLRPEAAAARGGSLRMLALHNCSKISGGNLHDIALACPHLQHLFLGGSTFSVDEPRLWGPEPTASLLRYEQCVKDLCEAPLPAIAVRGGVSWGSAPLGLRDGAGLQLRKLAPTPVRQRSAYRLAACIAAAVLEMPRLQAVEVTFLPPFTAQALTALLHSGTYQDMPPWSGGGGRQAQCNPVPDVWDLCEAASVQRLRVAAAGLDGAAAGEPLGPSADDSGVFVGAVCAVNCSAANRLTPLHCAAEHGDAGTAQTLLELRACTDVRDTRGCTPLFLACEAGCEAAVAALLKAGADACLNNAAGEGPLYIAALRGHLPVVVHLLRHCEVNRIPWQDTGLYGDRWNPLMAAAVADRYDVACCLLDAGGAAAACLVNAQNRYGQTAVHIAARKGSAAMLKLLMQRGGAALISAADTSGETPVHIALRHKHAVAVALFRQFGCSSEAA